MKTSIAFLIISFCLPAIGFTATIIVPDDYPTIQQAINAAVDGDTVLVKPGTYKENIAVMSKVITLMSSDGPSFTHINGSQTAGVVQFGPVPAGPQSVFEGFSLREGKAISGGGGILCDGSSPLITNNAISLNTGHSIGGGILCMGASPIIRNNTISGNSAGNGGGISCRCYSFPTIEYNTISGNSAGNGGGISCEDGSSPFIDNNLIISNHANRGGGISCEDDSSPTIENNIISGNSTDNLANEGGGIYSVSIPTIRNNIIANNFASDFIYKHGNGGGISCYGQAFLENNIIHNNSAREHGGGIFCMGINTVIINNTITENYSNDTGGGIYTWSDPLIINSIIYNNMYDEINNFDPIVTYSNVKGGYPGEGNINADPLFTGNFHLTWLSPCINRGTNAGAPPMDIDGDPRPYMGTVDMGADEFVGVHPLGADKFNLIHNTKTEKVNFTLNAGATNGGRMYVLLCSVSGTVPGTPLPGGVATLPLNWDIVTSYALGKIFLPNFGNFLGTLNPAGSAKAVFDPDGILTGLAGLTMSFAYGLNAPWNFVSNPINVAIVP